MSEQLNKQASLPNQGLLGYHRAAIKYSIGRLWQSPKSTWITLIAIGIALSLPASLYLFLKNLKSLTDDGREVPTISLFIKKNISLERLQDRAELLRELSEIDEVTIIDKEAAINQFKEIYGFEKVIDVLNENPLPHVLEIKPNPILVGDFESELTTLAETLENYPEIDFVQMDIEWVQRLRAIIKIADRSVLVICILLALTVLLVVGNTIKLNIENRKDEIKVTSIVGATSAYIRRPFLYDGIWYGLFGGIFSLVIVHLALLFLISPVNDLGRLYASQFSISGLGILMTLKILLFSCCLGFIGAWLAVGRHLRKQV